MADLYIKDDLSPEDIAMVQALYSRSQKSCILQFDKVRNSDSGKFQEKYVINYGHKSIADCGTTTMFCERVSMLAAKAIQDNPMYSGQESSTRYIDYSKQSFVDPVGSLVSKTIQEGWVSFYIDNMAEVREHLRFKYPKKEGERKSVYAKAIKARSFDVMRAFIPAGMVTQLSWHSNFRQAWDKLAVMRFHPLEEIRDMSERLISNLREKYPGSFAYSDYEDTNNYYRTAHKKSTYFDTVLTDDKGDIIDGVNLRHTLDKTELSKYSEEINTRPAKTELPKFMADLGSITFQFYLDFGSFRDIQRHRNGVCRMPLLTTNSGFNSWYLDELPESVRAKAVSLIDIQKSRISSLECSVEEKQYYIAMGFNVWTRVTYGLPASVYVIELRSGKTVHPTLRARAIEMHHKLKEVLPDLVMHTDLDRDDWDVRRGLQDIEEVK